MKLFFSLKLGNDKIVLLLYGYYGFIFQQRLFIKKGLLLMSKSSPYIVIFEFY